MDKYFEKTIEYAALILIVTYSTEILIQWNKIN